MAARFTLDRDGVAELLKSDDMRRALHEFADPAAANAGQTSGLPIEVTDYTTDRAAVSIAIDHPAGMAEQAKHGTLTRAAASVGLEVTER